QADGAKRVGVADARQAQRSRIRRVAVIGEPHGDGSGVSGTGRIQRVRDLVLVDGKVPYLARSLSQVPDERHGVAVHRVLAHNLLTQIAPEKARAGEVFVYLGR